MDSRSAGSRACEQSTACAPLAACERGGIRGTSSSSSNCSLRLDKAASTVTMLRMPSNNRLELHEMGAIEALQAARFWARDEAERKACDSALCTVVQ